MTEPDPAISMLNIVIAVLAGKKKLLVTSRQRGVIHSLLYVLIMVSS
ncbi:MAG: hypothetical protein ACXAEU_00435 [Candidatus Hodarchaeales archaeon]